MTPRDWPSQLYRDGYRHAVLDCARAEVAPVAPAAPLPAAPLPVALPTSGQWSAPEMVKTLPGGVPMYYFHVDDPFALDWFLRNLSSRAVLSAIHPSTPCGEAFRGTECDGDSIDDFTVRVAYYTALSTFFSWRAATVGRSITATDSPGNIE